ncbi:MAG: hypothetical protein VW644_09550, partial [Alphaproteobacteria bacterium]
MSHLETLLARTQTLFAIILIGIAAAAGTGWVVLERTADTIVETAAEQAALSWANFVGGELTRVD